MRLLSGDSSDVARVAVQALTAEQREDVFRFALSVLPAGHQLRPRIDELLRKAGQKLGHVDDAIAEQIYETAVEVWREIEALKAAAALESARTIEEYRSTWIARLEEYLALGSIVKHELDEIQKAFSDGHEHHPDFGVWVYRNELPKPDAPGALHFLELANGAAWAVARAGADSAWKLWLEVLVAYLLKNDVNEEHMQKFPSGGRSLGSTSNAHPGCLVQGENYRIRAAFKASEHCCSWLTRLMKRDQAGRALTQVDIVSPAPAPILALKEDARRTLQACNWEDIEISFVSDERVQITVSTETETRNYEEMGFGSKKNGAPLRAWETLRALAGTRGVVTIASDSRKWAEVEKRMQEIRRAFRRLFGVTGDPLPYMKKTRRNPQNFGYRARFKIGCRPSYEC